MYTYRNKSPWLIVHVQLRDKSKLIENEFHFLIRLKSFLFNKEHSLNSPPLLLPESIP